MLSGSGYGTRKTVSQQGTTLDGIQSGLQYNEYPQDHVWLAGRRAGPADRPDSHCVNYHKRGRKSLTIVKLWEKSHIRAWVWLGFWGYSWVR
jgi:hypothetical protein